MSQAEVFELHPAAKPVTFNLVGERGPLFKALAAAQGLFQPIERTRTVHVKSDKGNYEFDYAPLDEVLRKTVPALSANGLAVWNPIGCSGDDLLIGAVLSHESGTYLEAQVVVPRQRSWWKDGQKFQGAKSNQELGSDITYWKRYLLCALLGVSADQDDDGAAGEDMPRTVTEKGPRQNTQAKPPTPKAKPVEQGKPAAQLRAVSAPADAAPEEKPVTKETRMAIIPLLKELGMSQNLPMMEEWATKLIGLPLSQLTTEAHGQLLLSDLQARKAAKGEGDQKEAS